MHEEIAVGAFSDKAVSKFIEAAWPRDPLAEPRVMRWRLAGRTMLMLLLAASGLQYYFLEVYLTIMTLPRLTVAAGLP